MKYTVLVLDIVGSRDIERRKVAQQLLIKATTYLNDAFSKSLKSEVAFTTGDELQGLFVKTSAAYLYYRLLEMMIYPIEIRIGLGRGTLDLYDEGWETNKLDGKCYHNARKAIEIAKDNQLKVIYYSNNDEDKKMNATLHLLAMIKKPMTFLGYMNYFVFELFFPLIDQESIEMNSYAALKDIIALKYQLTDNKYEELAYDLLENFDFSKRKLRDYQQLYDEDTIIINSFFRRGYVTKMAPILKTSRQNIAKQLNIHRIPEIRNFEVALLVEFDKED